MTIAVICDSCRKTGTAGTGDFAHLGASISSVSQTDPQIKALLEFTPVPRQGNRVDGWSAEKQVAFIAALATTGSTRRAAKALDMSPYGIVKLREARPTYLRLIECSRRIHLAGVVLRPNTAAMCWWNSS